MPGIHIFFDFLSKIIFLAFDCGKKGGLIGPPPYERGLTLSHMALFVLFIEWPGGQVDPHTQTTLLEIEDDFDDVRGAYWPPAMHQLCRQ